MSKLEHKTAELIERQISEALAMLTPGELRPSTASNDQLALYQPMPINPERARYVLLDILPWIQALKEQLGE